MIKAISRTQFLSLSVAALLPWRAAAAQSTAADPPEPLMKKMLEAIKTRSYEDFLLDCDDKMRAALSKQMFEGVSNQLAPRLRQGYKTAYLGKIRQQGFVTYLWKLELADGKDEILARMSMKDGKVGGFLLQ
jgi:hypothetical protein